MKWKKNHSKIWNILEELGRYNFSNDIKLIFLIDLYFKVQISILYQFLLI